ncbi:MAG: THUMP domain-containing class I SAM-dependent RNA methyltransferase [Lachnospiraceae bacterium]
MPYSFLATAAFGLEGIVSNELKRLGYSAKAEQGCARFTGELADGFRANLCLRTADRVLLLLDEKPVLSFEELFQFVSSLPWENYLDRSSRIHVSGKCVRSQLMSVRDCQSIVKKAIVERLKKRLRVDRLPETGPRVPIEIALYRDQARLTIDMSGDALNRRGYRTWNGEAPLRETLAAALLDVSPWRTRMPLYDPCCGTGTILIEAAIKAAARPAGIDRSFVCEEFPFMKDVPMAAIRQAERDKIPADRSFSITGSDIDPEALELCRRHIHQAGFDGQITVQQQDLRTLQVPGEPGVFLCNPPYGERLGDKREAEALYREMGLLLEASPRLEALRHHV